MGERVVFAHAVDVQAVVLLEVRPQTVGMPVHVPREHDQFFAPTSARYRPSHLENSSGARLPPISSASLSMSA